MKRPVYFKQMPINSEGFLDDSIEIYSFNRISHLVTQTIMEQLTKNHGWTQEAAIQFIKSKAMRIGLDQSLGELLENATAEWVKKESPAWRENCYHWADQERRG